MDKEDRDRLIRIEVNQDILMKLFDERKKSEDKEHDDLRKSIVRVSNRIWGVVVAFLAMLAGVFLK